MLEKFTAKAKTVFSGNKVPDSVTSLPEQCNTLEKALAHLAMLELKERELRDAQSGSARHSLLRGQIQNMNFVIAKFRIEQESIRIAAQFVVDKSAIESALKDAQAQEVKAAQAVKIDEEKHAAILDRLAPLLEKQRDQQEQAAAAYLVAQDAFDAAIAGGDDAAEAMAAERLAEAEAATRTGAGVSSPTGLRIAALTKELAASTARKESAQDAFESAAETSRVARANLALWEYDVQASKLFDAWVKQFAAVRSCGPNTRFASNTVNEFGAQISDRARFIFPSRGDNYNIGYVTTALAADVARAMAMVPDLAVLAKDPNKEPLNPPVPSDLDRSETVEATQDDLLASEA